MRLLLVAVAVLALLAAAPLAGADEPEEADESALVEEALDECEADPVCAEEVEAEEAEAEASLPAECALRSATAHAVLKRNRLKLTIGYTASEPTKATIQLRYGASKLGTLKRHLGRSGVLRTTAKLNGVSSNRHSRVRIELDPEGAGCPSRRLVLFPR